jgi:DNA-binding response OmpR family regulator
MESILIVDDDINLCNILTEELGDNGYDTRYLTEGKNVAGFLNDNKTDLVLLDLKIPDKDGFEIQRDINSQPGFKPKVIILTAYSDIKTAIKSARLGASDFFSKPYDFNELLMSIRKVLPKVN